MHQPNTSTHSRVGALRAVARPVARYRRLAWLTMLVTAATTLGVAAFMEPEYDASMKLLVRRVRTNPAVASSTAGDYADVTADSLNSEVELLKSRDVLARVADATGMVVRTVSTDSALASAGPTDSLASADDAVSGAVRVLQQHLRADAVAGSTLIQVHYRSADPVQSVDVLTSLAQFYVEKHLAVHHPSGAQAFFQRQSLAVGESLRQAEDRLSEFQRTEQVVMPSAERDRTLQSLAEADAALSLARAGLAESAQRIETLQRQLATTPSRQTTQVQTAASAEHVRQVTSTLVELERARADVARRASPQEPSADELTARISRTRTELAAADRVPVIAETTDQNPTHQWLRDELARATTTRDGLSARVRTLSNAVDEYREAALRLDALGVRADGLRDAVASAKGTYELYARRQEEARVSEALDQTRLADVVIAEAPGPAQRSNARRLQVLGVGLTLALLAGVGAAFARDAVTPGFRDLREVEDVLGVPVLATLPTDVRATS